MRLLDKKCLLMQEMSAVGLFTRRYANFFGPFARNLFGLVKSIDYTDGLRVIFNTGRIVHIRPSGNAPELRVYAEAEGERVASDNAASALRMIPAEVQRLSTLQR